MRAATAAATTVVATAALFLGWHQGSGSQSGPLAGVHVVAAGPTGGPSAGATSSKAKTHSSKAKTHSSKARTPRATSSARRSIDGALVQTPYGDVQVRVVLNGPKITDVRALRLTDANGRSRQISAGAAPILRREALAAQSAQIDTVSGATYTSEGYQQSLQAALDQAHA